jgi:nucleotide-binding universal stress UspA family protein
MFKHILVPLDGSALAESALPAALELARHFESKITLLRVAQAPLLPNIDGYSTVELDASLRDQARQEAIEYLRGQAGSLRQQGYDVRVHSAVGQPVAEHILSTADLLEIDTIVMSTHGWGGLRRWVYGSVADKVLRHAKIPVVLIRASESERESELSHGEKEMEALN